MKRFQNNVIHPSIADAIKIAESLLVPNSNMMKTLSEKNDWKYPKGLTGKEVVEALLKEEEPLKVFTYKPFWSFSKALAYYQNGAVYFNVYKLNSLNVVDVASILCHEMAHYKNFGHGNNFKTKNKVLYSVPYFIGENVAKWL